MTIETTPEAGKAIAALANGDFLRMITAGGNSRRVPAAASFAMFQGGIVDTITNANGTAGRWESGLQMCLVPYSFASVNVDWQAHTGGRRSLETDARSTFPAAFVNDAVAITNIRYQGSVRDLGHINTATRVDLLYWHPTGITGVSVSGTVAAIGFWK